MKLHLLLWFALTAFAQAANLEFAETSQNIRSEPGSETVAVDFSFTNKGKKAVLIAGANAGCACMKIVFSGGKLNYAPGESGILRAIFTVGNYSGTVDRTIGVWLDPDPKSPPSQSLKVRIQIPVAITLEPKTLKWVLEGKAEPQTIHLLMAEGKPIHVTGIKPSTDQFAYELKTVEKGRKYDLVVTPRDMTTPGVGVLSIETDCDSVKDRVQQAYAIVHYPMATAAAATPGPGK